MKTGLDWGSGNDLSFCCKSRCLLTLCNTAFLFPIANPVSWKQNYSLVQVSFVSALLLLPISLLFRTAIIISPDMEKQSLCAASLCHFLCIYLCIYLSVCQFLSVSIFLACLCVWFLVYQSYSLSLSSPIHFILSLCPYFAPHDKHTTQYTAVRVEQLGSFVVVLLALSLMIKSDKHGDY